MSLLFLFGCLVSTFSCLWPQAEIQQEAAARRSATDAAWVPSNPQSEVQYPANPGDGVLVTINPGALIGVGLDQSWSCVDAPLGSRQIKGRPLSRVNVKLKPLVSHEGAVVRMRLEGTSAGQTTSKRNANELVLNTLTRFESEQHLWIDANGFAFSEPAIEVQSSQSLDRVKSRNPLAGAFAKTGLNHFSEQVKEQSREFSRGQIHGRLAEENADLQRQAMESVDRLMVRFPLLKGYDWHFSSDERNIYIASESGGDFMQPAAIKNAALTIAVHESQAENWLNQRLANRTLDSQQVGQRYAQMASRLELPELEPEDKQEWSVRLGDQPARLRIEDDGVSIELKMDSIQSGERTLNDWTLQFHYRWERQKRWSMIRNERIELSQTGLAGDGQGARQQVFRTVMRKRFERILPGKIVIPELTGLELLRDAKIELDVQQILADNRSVVLAFERR